MKINKSIKTEKNEKVYCMESYAQEAYEKYKSFPFINKNFKKGDVFNVIDIKRTSDEKLFEAVCENYVNLFFNFKKEKKFFSLYKLSYDDFINYVDSGSFHEILKTHNFKIMITDAENMMGSFFDAHKITLSKEFYDQIKDNSIIYVGKIVDKNRGGFFVDISGIITFMPGSLASANVLLDFDGMIGKEVKVMIEGYQKDKNIFITSNKKYLKYIIPIEIQKFNIDDILPCNVTGVSKNGIFVEHDYKFTGFIKKQDMSQELRDKFINNDIKNGDMLLLSIKNINYNINKLEFKSVE